MAPCLRRVGGATPSWTLLFFLCFGLTGGRSQGASDDATSSQAQLDALGPMSLGKDGSISRIANWDQLTATERDAAVRLLAARNEKRRRKLLLEMESAEQQQQQQKQRTPLRRRIGEWLQAAWRTILGVPSSSTRTMDFAPEFVRPVLEGGKRATTRYVARRGGGEHHLAALRAGSRVVATCVRCDDEAARAGFAHLEIRRTEHARCDELNATLAATEGLDSADTLRAALRRFYPALRDSSRVVVFHFDAEPVVAQTAAGGAEKTEVASLAAAPAHETATVEEDAQASSEPTAGARDAGASTAGVSEPKS